MGRRGIHFPANGTQNSDDDAVDALHANMLRYFSDVVEELGGQPRELLRKLGIPEKQLGGHTPNLSYRQTIDLLELAAATLGCPDFGMRLAIRQGGSQILGRSDP